jgi:hypothetical protein
MGTMPILLADGTVLVAGGNGGPSSVALSSAEVYTPTTGTWAPVGSMAAAREGLTATRLTNGNVLIVGGTTTLQA